MDSELRPRARRALVAQPHGAYGCPDRQLKGRTEEETRLNRTGDTGDSICVDRKVLGPQQNGCLRPETTTRVSGRRCDASDVDIGAVARPPFDRDVEERACADELRCEQGRRAAMECVRIRHPLEPAVMHKAD